MDKMALGLGCSAFLQDEGYIDTGKEMRGWEGMRPWPHSLWLLELFQAHRSSTNAPKCLQYPAVKKNRPILLAQPIHSSG